jgi:hypothetical protein
MTENYNDVDTKILMEIEKSIKILSRRINIFYNEPLPLR